MAKANRGKRAKPARRANRAPSGARAARRGLPDFLLPRARAPEEGVWRGFWPVLALAFAARAVVALSGDFAMHPDEIMQYLEQAHRLVFGAGVVHWEHFYGARSWIVPGPIAGLLAALAALGLDGPAWYVGGVELAFCAFSLTIPAGMYFFARRHFDESAARLALLAGAFWYELVGFAHKPMTEFVAAGLLMVALALCVRPAPARTAVVVSAAVLAVLAAAVRMQYAPLALLLLGVCFLRAGGAPGARWRSARARLVFAAVLAVAAVGAFDAVTWSAGPFHSYIANLRFNLALEEARAGSSPPWQYLWHLSLAGAGLSALCIAAALRHARRYGFLLLLIAVTLVVHSLEAHKEYRFVFAAIPLWLLVGADLTARLAAGRPAWVPGAVGAAFAAASLAGILNALPRQDDIYRLVFAPEETPVRFVRGADPAFAAYRYLSDAPGVSGVWHLDRPYHSMPGYYYLHRRVPLYDAASGARLVGVEAQRVQALVSHIVTSDAGLSAPGYELEKAFGDVRILRRIDNETPVRGWRDYTPTVIGESIARIMADIDPGAPPPPADFGVRFAAP